MLVPFTFLYVYSRYPSPEQLLLHTKKHQTCKKCTKNLEDW